MVLIAQIALGVIIGFSHTAEPTGTLVLACVGTTMGVSREIIVNFNVGTVEGIRINPYLPDSAKVTAVSETKVTFESHGSDWTVAGTIDRVTSDVRITETVGKYQSDYLLKCKSTQRML